MAEEARPSTYVLHDLWVRLENEHHELAAAMERACRRGADVTPMRVRQARLLLDINALVAAIREAPAHTLEDYLALLDVALEHEIDLAADMAFYGPADYPMITRLLRELAQYAPGFDFNSLRRWLSLPGQLGEVIGEAARAGSAAKRTHPLERIRLGREQDTGQRASVKPVLQLRRNRQDDADRSVETYED